MMICFRCTAETKECLDQLLASGMYKDYGEAIAAAVRNQVMMEKELEENGSIVIGAVSPPPSPESPNGRVRTTEQLKRLPKTPATVKKEKASPGVPLLFRSEDFPG